MNPKQFFQKTYEVLRENNSKRIIKNIVKIINKFIRVSGYKLTRDIPYIYLHKYNSYDEYVEIQKFTNKRKLDRVWADDKTLQIVADRVKENIPENKNYFLNGICHGSRNGYEVNKLNERLNTSEVIGTDISETAKDYKNLVVWDFHKVNPDWNKKFDFVYTNSLDQAQQPFEAIKTWLGQLKKDGILFIEHSRTHHGVDGVTDYDPFGVLPEFMPYALCEEFGHSISIEIMTTKKSNNNIEICLFIIKNQP